MYKLPAVIYIAFISIYNLLNIVIKFINKNENDDEKISDRMRTRLIVSGVSGIFVGILYIKYFAGFTFIKYLTLIVYLVITGYIDAHTKIVYTFFSMIFLFIGLIFLGITVFSVGGDLKTCLLGIVICVIISLLSMLFKFFSWGDFDVFIISSLFIGGLLGALNILIALTLSGLVALFCVILKRKKLTDSFAVCPYIAISTYLIMLFM